MELKMNKRCYKGRLHHSAFCETSVGLRPCCENIMSSTKPETPPKDEQARAIGNMNKNSVKFLHLVFGMQTDRQTNYKQTQNVSFYTYSSRVVIFDVGVELYSVSLISLKSSVIIYRPTMLLLSKLNNPLAGGTLAEQ